MQQNMLIIMFFIQFIIQYVIYKQVRFTMYWCMSATDDITNGDLRAIEKVAWISAFSLNIGISLLVRFFTASGSLSGMSNLAASIVLSLFMAYDLKSFLKLIKKSKETKYAKHN